MTVNVPQVTTDVIAMMDGLLTSWDYAIVGGAYTNVSPLPDYWSGEAAPAAAGAALDNVRGTTSYLARAIAATEWALTNYATRVDGSFGPAASTDNTIDTMEFGKSFCATMLLYGDAIPAEARLRWANKIRGGCDYLRSRGAIAYYTNGNIEIGEFVFLRLAYLVCGDEWIAEYAERVWWVLHHPEEALAPDWAGWGVVYDNTTIPYVAATAATTETGYFTEEGGGGVGLDWDYSQYQLDELAFYYVLSKDPRIPRLINMIMNKIWPRVTTTGVWNLNTMGGSRQGFAAPTTPRPIAFITPALAVATLVMGRTDLIDITGQVYDTGAGVGSYAGVYGVGGTARGPAGSEETAQTWHRGSYQQLGTLLLALASLRRPNWPRALLLTPSLPERRRWIAPLS